jgi:hypothetical protein
MLAYDNPSWLHARVHSRLLIPEVLKWFGILPAVGPATFVLQAPGREESQLEVETIAPGQALNLVQPWGPKKVPEPLYLVSRNENYWFKLLPESKTIYLQYNSCRDRADLRFEEFTKQVFTFVNEHPVDRFVVDLRWNGGGGADVVLPLISALEKRPAINAKGHLFVLIGRETFSSGMDDAIYFRDRTQALFVGEPTGGKPNSYGEVQRLELPYSHTVISYSTKFSHPIRGSDPASFEPDIPVTVSSQQYFAGEDPYLAAALAYH